MSVTLTVETAPRAEDAQTIHDGLLAYNQAAGGADLTPFALFARDAGDAVVGGMLGYVRLGCLFVDKFWIAEAQRGGGLGTRMMQEAEAHARTQGCTMIELDTYSFQALPFYRKHGFEPFGTLEGFESGHAKYFLVKRV